MTVSARADFRIGVDLGGTKIELIALDPAGRELHRARIATPAHDAAAIVEAIARLVREAEAALGGRGSVGVGMPGSLSPASGRVRNSNTVVLNGRALDRELSEALQREVRVANDANCFALSEAVDGAGRDAGVVFGVILGTGVGGGIVIDKRPLIGANAVAGEWGHNPLPWPEPDELPGPACYCGKHGCVETFLSGPALARDHAIHENESRSAPEISAAAERGDAAALRSLARYHDRMARALATVIDVLDPDAIVLGGGLSQIPSLYTEVPTRLPSYVFSDVVRTPMRRALHGDASGVRGAAWLWPVSP
jgi:predicted NBD/HSP70 family sugar kinase